MMACRRCDKIDAASKRIANAKKYLLLEIKSELSPPVSCNSSSSQEKKRKLNLPMSSPDETKSALDWEDLIIEYLLLRGVSQCFRTYCVLPLFSIKCWPFDLLGILLTSTWLLLQVERRQLEDGYYRAALDIHHMESTDQINDNDLIPYLRSQTEVHRLCYIPWPSGPCCIIKYISCKNFIHFIEFSV